MNIPDVVELGTVGVLFFFFLREFFAYLKTKKNGNGNGEGQGLNQLILEQLQTMNSNHLHSIEDAINDGNQRLIDSMHQDNMKMIELLGEIKGKLK